MENCPVDISFSGKMTCKVFHRKWRDLALKFYFDTHIAKAAAVQLRANGVDVVRCEEVDLAAASDEAHLQYATENERIMV